MANEIMCENRVKINKHSGFSNISCDVHLATVKCTDRL